MKRYVPSHLKHANRRIIYEWITEKREFSRAQIQKNTHISGPTVHKVIQYFLDKNIVCYTGSGLTGTVGRQPSMMRWLPDFAYSANWLVEGDFTALGLVDMSGTIIYLQRQHIKHMDLDALLTELPELIASAIVTAGIPKQKLCAVGIGIPGVLSTNDNVIQFAPLIGIDKPYDCNAALQRVQQQMNVPVILENDVNAAAWGSYRMHPFKNADLVYYSLGTGLGAGIVFNGQLRRGRSGLAGEIGYSCFDQNFITVQNRPGWLEQKINLQALREQYGFDIDDIASLEHEPTANQCINPDMITCIADYLSLCIVNYHLMMEIDVFILGGVTAQAIGKPLLDAVREQVRRMCFDMPDIEMDALPEAGIVGLASLASDTMLANLLREDDA